VLVYIRVRCEVNGSSESADAEGDPFTVPLFAKADVDGFYTDEKPDIVACSRPLTPLASYVRKATDVNRSALGNAWVADPFTFPL
jgi:hypothetical protein